MAKTPAATKTRTRLLVDERRAQLLALGIHVFSERPYDEVTIDDLARAAGVSKGLLYHYFPTKRDFYVAALEHASKELVDAALAAPSGASPEERLRRGLHTYLSFVERHGPAYVAVVRGGIGGSDPEVLAIVERTRATFIDRISREIPGRVTPLARVAMRGWIGFVEATALDWITERRVARERLVDVLVAVLFHAVGVALASSQSK